jgi:hypothetical protein
MGRAGRSCVVQPCLRALGDDRQRPPLGDEGRRDAATAQEICAICG